jgi:predicted nucleic acid-binding protein
MKVYLDVCCLNRPFDDQAQPRTRLESEAVLLVLGQCETGEIEWVSSEVVAYEIDRTPDPDRRAKVAALVSFSRASVGAGAAEIARAEELQDLGFRPFDALHIACAESAGAEVFFTTDDKLLRKCRAVADRLAVKTANPLSWVQRPEEEP